MCALRWSSASTAEAKACGPACSTGDELYDRLRTLPGYGDEKAKIFVAILGKRFDVRPEGWQEAAGKFGDDSPRSVADITDRHVTRQGPRVEEGGKGRQEGQAGSAGRLSARATGMLVETGGSTDVDRSVGNDRAHRRSSAPTPGSPTTAAS